MQQPASQELESYNPADGETTYTPSIQDVDQGTYGWWVEIKSDETGKQYTSSTGRFDVSGPALTMVRKTDVDTFLFDITKASKDDDDAETKYGFALFRTTDVDIPSPGTDPACRMSVQVDLDSPSYDQSFGVRTGSKNMVQKDIPLPATATARDGEVKDPQSCGGNTFDGYAACRTVSEEINSGDGRISRNIQCLDPDTISYGTVRLRDIDGTFKIMSLSWGASSGRTYQTKPATIDIPSSQVGKTVDVTVETDQGTWCGSFTAGLRETMEASLAPDKC